MTSDSRDEIPPQLPALEPPVGDWWHAQARQVRRGPSNLLLLPFAAPVGKSRGRRFRIKIGDAKPRTRVVVALAGQAAVILPEVEAREGVVDVAIAQISTHRLTNLPSDAREALEANGVQPDDLSPHELTQLIVMVTESATPEIRTSRIQAAVEALGTRIS
jgi:hypothetical protein